MRRDRELLLAAVLAVLLDAPYFIVLRARTAYQRAGD
jgi:hypothetical protein